MYDLNDIDKMKLKIWNAFYSTNNPKYMDMINRWHEYSKKEGKLIDLEEYRNEKDKR